MSTPPAVFITTNERIAAAAVDERLSPAQRNALVVLMTKAIDWETGAVRARIASTATSWLAANMSISEDTARRYLTRFKDLGLFTHQDHVLLAFTPEGLPSFKESVAKGKIRRSTERAKRKAKLEAGKAKLEAGKAKAEAIERKIRKAELKRAEDDDDKRAAAVRWNEITSRVPEPAPLPPINKPKLTSTDLPSPRSQVLGPLATEC